MIAFAVFTILATCIASTLLQTRRMTESDIAQAEAQTVAQGILEQVQLIPYNTLEIDASPPPVTLKFVNVTSENLVEMQDFDLSWVTDGSDTYTSIGAVQGGVVKGVLLDVDYKNTSSSVVRNRRYMIMKVKLTKTVDAVAGDVGIVLNYQYVLPDRKSSSGTNVFLTQQLRTVRSQTASY